MSNQKLTVGELVYKISGDMDNLKTELKKAETQIGKLEKSMERSQKTTVGWTKGILSLKTAFIGFVSSAIAQGIFSFVKAGAELNELENSFARLSAGIGLNSNDILNNLRKLSSGTISNKDLILSANRAITLGVAKDMEEFSTLMQVARIRARDMGITTTQAFNDIVTGIGRSSPLILDNLGIVIKQNEAYNTYAKSLNKTAEALTDNERREALKYAVLEQSRKQIEEVGEVNLSYADRIQQVSTKLTNLKSYIGKSLLPAFEVLVSNMVDAGDSADDMAKKIDTAGRAFYRIANAFLLVGGGLKQLWKSIQFIGNGIQIAFIGIADGILLGSKKILDGLGRDTTAIDKLIKGTTQSLANQQEDFYDIAEDVQKTGDKWNKAFNQMLNPTEYSPATVDDINKTISATAGALDETANSADVAKDKIEQFQGKLVSLIGSAKDAREKLEKDLADKFTAFGDALTENVKDTVNGLAQITISAEDKIKDLKKQLSDTSDRNERLGIQKQIKEQEKILDSREDFEQRQSERITAIRAKLEEAGIDASKAGLDNLLNVRTLEEQIEEERRIASLDEFQRFEEQQSRKLVLLTDALITEKKVLDEKINTQKQYETDLTSYLTSENSKRLNNTDNWANATIEKYGEVADSLKNLLSLQSQLNNISGVNPVGTQPVQPIATGTQQTTNNTTNNNISAPVTINGESIQNLSPTEISAILGFELNKFIR